MTTREEILKAAERVFSSHGYDGTSMRQIAAEAGVAQALLHYHFQNKENLYASIFDRRSSAISGHRGNLLDRLLADTPHPTLEEVLGVLFTPTENALGESREDVDPYVQIVAAIGAANDPRSKELVARYFDPIAKRFIDLFQQVVPGLDGGRAVWSYLIAIRARMQAQALIERAARLCKCTPDKVPPADELLVPFVSAGIRAIAQMPASAPRTPRKRTAVSA